MTDPVPLDRPGHPTEWGELQAIGRYGFRVRVPSVGEDCVFDWTGRPDRKHRARFRGYYVPRREAQALASRSEEKPRSKRQRLADEILSAVLEPTWWEGWQRATEVTLIDRGDLREYRADVLLYELRPFPLVPESQRESRFLALELKSGKADFQRDSKWPGLRRLVHGLAFAAPAGTIQLSELDTVSKRIGLYEWDGLDLQCVRAPVFRDELPLETVIDTQRGLLLAAQRGQER